MKKEIEYPLVSIIIVTYNAEQYLSRCLTCIAEQSYPNLEIVVMDGASADSTVEIIQSYSSLITFWHSEPDNGIYDAMNKALNHIHGEWVYFLGADDLVLPGFSELLFQELKDKNTIYYGGIIIGEHEYTDVVSRYKQAKEGICHQAIVYPAQVFQQYRYDTKYLISSDHHLNMRCQADPKFAFRFVNYTLANFNNTGVSSLHKDKLLERDKFRLIIKYFGLFIAIRYAFKRMKDQYFRKKKK